MAIGVKQITIYSGRSIITLKEVDVTTDIVV